MDYADIDAFGAHIVRNNVIRRCGEAGIAGQKGATRCLIAGNLIEDTNYRKEFGGWETAAIKFHESVRHSCRSSRQSDPPRLFSEIRDGICCMDWANRFWTTCTSARRSAFGWTGPIREPALQATSFTTRKRPMFSWKWTTGRSWSITTCLSGKGSGATPKAACLCTICSWTANSIMVSDTIRSSQYYKPHTRKEVGSKHGIPSDDKWFNNIFVRRGLEGVNKAPGYSADYNVFMEGAKKSSFGDDHSVVDSCGSQVPSRR